ncbi:MAG: transporter substrate-binding domain-containing protein [Candidatus Thiodiazotropha sp. (ex Dulcina madagascariensis)]|nr:transporter substrate-binding domain-containing protein [Candidatus Thiodiazotropha sp. (ex Dulcina madagascariensis)]
MSWTSRQIWVCIWVLTMSATAHAEQLTFTTGDWRPYIFEENGTVGSKTPGFSIEIVNSVFANLGYDIVYKTSPFLRQIKEVERGEFTALVGVYREEAPNLIFPQEPIGMTRNCFYTKTGHTWQYESLEDLLSVKFATISGYTYGEIDSYIKANDARVMKLTGSEVDMMKRLTKLVDSDRVTAFVQDVAVAEYFFKIEGVKGRYQRAGCLPFIETMVGFSPNDPRTTAFVQEFDIEIEKLRSSGELKKILTKYGIADWK